MKKEKKITGGNYLAFGLYAFGGLGMEIVILMIEQMIYGTSMNEMTPIQMIIHWVLTCIVWFLFTYFLSSYAKKHYQFNIFGEKQEVPLLNWATAILLTAICIALNAWSWEGLKVIEEFSRKGLLLFLFQYLYYAFEILLVLSVIVYGQKAGELWFGKPQIPYGGLLVGLSWGLVHALTKGSLFVGIEAMFAGIIYGCIYLLMKKQSILAYPLILFAFAV